MDSGSENRDTAAGKTENTENMQTATPQKGQERSESLEENLEKLAALNLSNDQSLQPRFSTAVLRLVSALAGIGALLLIYFILKLFI